MNRPPGDAQLTEDVGAALIGAERIVGVGRVGAVGHHVQPGEQGSAASAGSASATERLNMACQPTGFQPEDRRQRAGYGDLTQKCSDPRS